MRRISIIIFLLFIITKNTKLFSQELTIGSNINAGIAPPNYSMMWNNDFNYKFKKIIGFGFSANVHFINFKEEVPPGGYFFRIPFSINYGPSLFFHFNNKKQNLDFRIYNELILQHGFQNSPYFFMDEKKLYSFYVSPTYQFRFSTGLKIKTNWYLDFNFIFRPLYVLYSSTYPEPVYLDNYYFGLGVGFYYKIPITKKEK